ncbi:chloride channel [Aureococcus anophagefferens]|nr:chloride channel [Aureococcus anophagefferens]
MWTWKKVAQATSGRVADLAHGPSCAQSRLRLFGASEKDVRVTLFRDHHAWCPYCQKIWLWLEEKRVPYRVKKVTMFCYGEKSPVRRRGQRSRAQFEAVADAVEDLLGAPGAFFLGDEFTTADVVFVPYVERMSASLFYYKGFQLRDPAARPRLCAWFDNLSARPIWARSRRARPVDARAGVPETTAPVPDDAKIVRRVAQFRSQIAAVNGELADAAAVDGALLAAVANLLDGGTAAAPPPNAAPPRGRTASRAPTCPSPARALCAALEATAALDRRGAAVEDPPQDRRDQDPRPFKRWRRVTAVMDINRALLGPTWVQSSRPGSRGAGGGRRAADLVVAVRDLEQAASVSSASRRGLPGA